MKIFYAVQATGNGHIARAMELLPHLQRYGEVDIFLSGSNSTMQMAAPVKYRSKGISFFYTPSGGLDYIKTIRNIAPLRWHREAKVLPVEKYDLVINDFEHITSMACEMKKVHSVNFGHQASFMSGKVPRPEKKDIAYEWLIRNYGKASEYVGLHFESYDDFILPPVLKKEVLEASPTDEEFYIVYLPAYSDAAVAMALLPLKGHRFKVFSKEIKNHCILVDNILFAPVSGPDFTKSMIRCSGLVTSAGFEAPAEALAMGKKVLAIPIKGQYEQACNAAALKQMGVACLKSIGEVAGMFDKWAADKKEIRLNSVLPTEAIVGMLMGHYALAK